ARRSPPPPPALAVVGALVGERLQLDVALRDAGQEARRVEERPELDLELHQLAADAGHELAEGEEDVVGSPHQLTALVLGHREAFEPVTAPLDEALVVRVAVPLELEGPRARGAAAIDDPAVREPRDDDGRPR